MKKWMIYGANGYSGELIAREAKNRGLTPILAGCNASAVKILATELDFCYQIFDLDYHDIVAKNLAEVDLLLNCAGPFSATSQVLIHSCIKQHCHYLDITGEIDVFEYAQSKSRQALKAGIVLCPGVGFDVIPTDCVALALKKALPDATHLSLGFESKSPLSPGTAKTAIEGLPSGGRVRIDGEMKKVPLAYQTRKINFGNGEKLAMTIPWGDISTAYFSTQIPNIEVYVPVSPKRLKLLRRLNFIRWCLGLGFIQHWLKGRAQKATGPNQSQLDTLSTYIWGEVKNAYGNTKRAQLKTSNGYALTVTGSLMVVDFILNNEVAGGYVTPSILLGESAVSKLPGCSEITISCFKAGNSF